MILIYFPASSLDEAKKISKIIIKENLVACTNIFQSNSIYSLKGEIKEDSEFVVFAKTYGDKAVIAMKRITELHSYKIPCVLKWDVESNPAYANWVKSELKS